MAPAESTAGYRLVQLAQGVYSVHSLAYRETFHPVVGPEAEARALYVPQLRFWERGSDFPDEFVIWDVGLGAAANAVTMLRATQTKRSGIRLVSFDRTLEPLEFALQHVTELSYLSGFESRLRELGQTHSIQYCDGSQKVQWNLHLGDFPALIANSIPGQYPEPQVIMFDAFSPATNPEMWTLPLFRNLFGLLAPGRPCLLPTYSRSTLLRVTLLLSGFFVGVGHATGEKEETTIAANTLELIEEPLDRRWLMRARRSNSAEPMREPVYRQQPLSADSWEKLQQHPQFS